MADRGRPAHQSREKVLEGKKKRGGYRQKTVGTFASKVTRANGDSKLKESFTPRPGLIF